MRQHPHRLPPRLFKLIAIIKKIEDTRRGLPREGRIALGEVWYPINDKRGRPRSRKP